MHYTLSNGVTNLQECIDNRDKKLRVSLRSITYTVGWYNIENLQTFMWTLEDSNDRNRVDIQPGLYGFGQLKEIIESSGAFGTLEVSKENGLITLTVANGRVVYMTKGLLKVLGLDGGRRGSWINEGIHIGTRPVDFATRKLLNIHLDQLNTTNNIVDGMRSTLLTTVGLKCLSYGDIDTVHFEHPTFKHLENGTIQEFKITIRDEHGNIINNHNLPIYITLEIQ